MNNFHSLLHAITINNNPTSQRFGLKPVPAHASPSFVMAHIRIDTSANVGFTFTWDCWRTPPGKGKGKKGKRGPDDADISRPDDADIPGDFPDVRRVKKKARGKGNTHGKEVTGSYPGKGKACGKDNGDGEEVMGADKADEGEERHLTHFQSGGQYRIRNFRIDRDNYTVEELD